MDRLTSKQLRDLLDFLRGGYACRDQDAFVAHLLHALPYLIPSEIISYNEVDLRRRSLMSTMAPSSAHFPGDRQLFDTHMAEHPLVAYYQQTRDGQAVKISDFLTQRQFHRLGLYQELYRRLGVEDQMSVHLAARSARLIAIALSRGRRDFSERDRLLLNLLRPHLVQAYANVQAITAMQQEVCLARQTFETNWQEVVALTKDGRVRLITPRARRWLAAYFGPPVRDTERLPEAVRAWITHQEAVRGRADDVPRPREPLRIERDRTCLFVRYLCEADQGLLLLEERRTDPQPASLEPFGLTRREAEVLRWVAQGKTNVEIGCILGVSPATVKKHLIHVYEKLGVETRMAAAALAQGWRSEG